jgi:hypothetical protein
MVTPLPNRAHFQSLIRLYRAVVNLAATGAVCFNAPTRVREIFSIEPVTLFIKELDACYAF